MSQAMHQIYDIWRILDRPSHDAEAEIRALTQVAYVGGNEALCRVLGRYKMYVDTRDIGIASHLMLEGFWELWVTKAMMRSVHRGSVVADIGANQGYFTLLLADLTGPTGRVLSFEPNPAMARLVRKSVEVNGFGGFVDFHEVGLGSHAGRAVMDASTHQPGGGRTVEAKKGDIVIKRLDKITRARSLDFIKMDVEGFEPMVWQGMTQLLARQKRMTVFMEFTVGRLKDPGGFLDQILKHGFSLEIIRAQDGIVPISREELLGGPLWVDHMLVFRRETTPRRKRVSK